MGHRVVGVDISETGISQLLEDARSEGLSVEGVVANLAHYEPNGDFDVIVIDRTLHMLETKVRKRTLARICGHISDGGFVLIADEKKNLPTMLKFFEQDAGRWTIVKRTASLLFVQKTLT